MAMTLEQAGGNAMPAEWMHGRSGALAKAARHRRLVQVLRLALPIVAVLALASYFLFAKLTFSVGNIKATISGVQLQSDRLTMLNPLLEGIANGSAYEVRADRAIQNITTPDIVELIAIRAKLSQPGDRSANLTADRGTFHTKRQKLTLLGNILIVTTAGEQARLTRADIDMKTQVVTSNEPVVFEMLNGTVWADTMTMYPKSNTVRLDGHIRVLIQPPTQNPADAATLRGTNGG